MRVDVSVETPVSRSVRARQVEALFDVPPGEKSKLHWDGDVPLEERAWNVGLIVGPSGCGKSTLARRMFGDAFHPELSWGGASVIDDVRAGLSVESIAEAFSSVGFGTIPAWLRPYAVLSNGERFRVDVARRMLELPDPIIIDEFTSVVDRQVAKVGSHAVQKFVRKHGRRFVAVTCHYDVVEWLQPDWVFEPATMTFTWRCLQRRPTLEVEVVRVGYEMWRLFAPFHYLSAELNRSASCFCAFVNEQPAAFIGVLYFPHPRVKNLMRVSRAVTLPDWQGLGLAFVLVEAVAAAYKATGRRFRNYPAHPAYVRAHDRSPRWSMVKEPGTFSPRQGDSAAASCRGVSKSRPCAVFEYVGSAHPDAVEAQRFLDRAA